jgi:excisionase family DNA binding protein
MKGAIVGLILRLSIAAESFTSYVQFSEEDPARAADPGNASPRRPARFPTALSRLFITTLKNKPYKARSGLDYGADVFRVRCFPNRVHNSGTRTTTLAHRTNSNMETSLLTVRELAEYLRVHQATIYRLVKEQKLPAFRVGSDWRFNREVIERWMIQEQKPS